MGKNQELEIEVLNEDFIIDITYSIYHGFGILFSRGELGDGIKGYQFKIISDKKIELNDSAKYLDIDFIKNLLQQQVARARITEKNDFEILLKSGVLILFNPHEEFEGWEFRWQGRLFEVAPPGGLWID